MSIKVFGKVQGVFYRKTAAEKAKSLRLLGWVKNSTDGTVEMKIQGSKAMVLEMIEWCKEGPKNAEVIKVEQEEIPLSDYSDFRIIR